MIFLRAFAWSASLAFAGAWAFIFHWGAAVAAIILLLVAAYGTQLIALIPGIGVWLAEKLAPLRHDLTWAAIAIAVFLGGQYIGAQDANKRCIAKSLVIEKTVDDAVKNTDTGKKDPWDRSDY